MKHTGHNFAQVPVRSGPLSLHGLLPQYPAMLRGICDVNLGFFLLRWNPEVNEQQLLDSEYDSA